MKKVSRHVALQDRVRDLLDVPTVHFESPRQQGLAGLGPALKAVVAANTECVKLLETQFPAWHFRVETAVAVGAMEIDWYPNEKVGWLKRTWYRILKRTPTEERVRRFLTSDKANSLVNR